MTGLLKRKSVHSSLSTRLLLWLIPPVVIILLTTGYVEYHTANRFIDVALQRTSKLQAMAVRHEVEIFLDRCRQDLLHISQEPLDAEKMRNYIARKFEIDGIEYRDLAFISQTDQNHIYIVAKDALIVQIPAKMVTDIRPNPMLHYEKVREMGAGEVWISPITEVEHPYPTPDNPNRTILSRVIYFGLPLIRPTGPGYLLLSVDARRVRDILSLYNSARSPIWAFPRTPEIRYSYLFDTNGWILFQSDDPDKPDRELGTDLARAPYTGTIGRPDLPVAFRPASVFGPYWKMVGDVREGKSGLIKDTDSAHQSDQVDEYFLAYAPVVFHHGGRRAPSVYAGIGYVDRSRLTLAAGYRQIDIMFIITLVTVGIVSALIYVLGRAVTRPILNLARAVGHLQVSGELHPVELPTSGYEAHTLLNAVNQMLETMQSQMNEIAIRDRQIETVSLKERADLQPVRGMAAAGSLPDIPGLVGVGTKIERLKFDIRKAAGVDVDVLIIGETGTGKQLAAEAVHALSRRKAKPFISINCGELDENLLLDTLFGHVKGAFTEARSDRKGAFVEAEGGTLFLDEVQSASAGVQQALLRAIAMRKVKQLGSDRDIDVDVRLIAATNVDLARLIEENRFRSDLYFRLKVISVHTPPLREMAENIPVLAAHFLAEMERVTQRRGLGLSRGALEKLKGYDWPGNTRELKNCLTRAVVMADHKVLQAGDILLEGEKAGWCTPEETGTAAASAAPPPGPDAGHRPPSSGGPATAKPLAVELNRRQETALPWIQERGGVTRSEYQELIGGGLPSRTAIYDLNDMVKKMLLKRVGKGPATRYVVKSTASEH